MGGLVGCLVGLGLALGQSLWSMGVRIKVFLGGENSLLAVSERVKAHGHCQGCVATAGVGALASAELHQGVLSSASRGVNISLGKR